METLLALWTFMCAVVSVSCAIYTWKLRDDISKRTDSMVELKDEIANVSQKTLELTQEISEDLDKMKPRMPHIPTSEEIEDALGDNDKG